MIIEMLAAILLLFLTTTIDATQHSGIAKTKWLEMCDIADNLRKVQNRLTALQGASGDAAILTLKQMFRTEILIEKASADGYKPTEKALIIYYARRAQQAIVKTQTPAVAATTNAVREAARAEGAIQESIGLARQLAASGTRSCLEDEGGSNNFRAHSKEYTTEAVGCRLDTPALTGAEEPTPKFGPNGITGEFAKTSESATASGSLACNLGSGRSGTTYFLNQGTGDSLAGTPTFGAGLLTMAANDLETLDATKLTDKQTAAPLLHRGHAAYLASTAPKEKFTFQDSEALAKDPTFQTVYKEIVLGWRPGDTEPIDLQSQITAAYGSPTNMAQTYNQAMTTTNVKNTVAKQPPEKPLSSIEDIGELVAVLIYYRNVNTKNLKDEIARLKAEAGKGTDKTPEQICNGIGENKTKCGETEGCHFVDKNDKGKQCTLTKEAAEKAAKASREAEGKDGKTEFNCGGKVETE
uniref:Variant surface glycoprotein 1163 n=1 Tax=Trypanosoma brucei TaxID=5691 RepID=M4SZG6_9TRYP|nr:variant surface glycoprotein 1163 [Trypanosoma brucei]